MTGPKQLTVQTALYRVRTWDVELQKFTEQSGLENPSDGISIHGLRRVLRELRGIGYAGRKGDPSVLVERINEDSHG